MSRIALSIIACILAGTALASPDLECPGASQIEIGDCVAETETRAEQAMQIMLDAALAQATELDEITGREVAVPALLASQAAWEAFREAECDYAGALFGGGSGTGIGITSCRIELTRARTRELTSRF